MHIFLSYASEDRARAEEIALALGNDGHEVFFDRDDLAGGEHYHLVIREQIAATGLLVFLVTPHSVQPGGYTLTELRAAQQRWSSPVGHVVPVLLEPTPMEQVPAYLRAVTLFEPRGNAAAEVAAHVHRLDRRHRTRRRIVVAGASVLVATGSGVLLWQTEQTRAGFRSSIEASEFVAAHVMPEQAVERSEYQLDPTARLPADGDNVVRLERLAFGRLADGRKAFHLRVSVGNGSAEPVQLDLTPRFFELADDRGQVAELLYFCCETAGDVLGVGERRVIELIYASAPGWQGKETTPGTILFRVTGLLPVLRATWVFRPLATRA